MSNWYNTLSSRERRLVFYGGIIVLLILIWLLALKPLIANHKKFSKRIVSQQKTLATMQEQRLQIKALQQQEIKPSANTGGNPQQLVERALQTWRLKPKLERMQSQGANGVRLSLKEAKADRVMRFLHDLEIKYNLSISKLVIDSAKNEAGFANVRLTIQKD